MASSIFPKSIALEIAIDHRIRGLFRPVPHSGKGSSGGFHVHPIEAFGHKLQLDEDEISVTAQLAGPFSTGGIAVVLQQPRDNHPFKDGIHAVIDDCDTFMALKESFAAASCDSLNIIHDVAVVDLLPYISKEELEEITETDKKVIRDALQTTVDFLVHKRPSAVFCAGCIRGYVAKGEARKVESIGIGNTFHNPFATLQAKNQVMAEVQRVNGFHPSSAMNYNPEHSCLRQLFLLEVAHTCAVHRGDWKEQTWMRGFRALCKGALSGRINERFVAMSRATRKDIPYYSTLYSERIELISTAIGAFNSRPLGAFHELYNTLIKSRLSEKCNDASLILRELSELIAGRWPPEDADEIQDSLTEIAEHTQRLTVDARQIDGWYQNANLRNTISTGIGLLGQCIYIPRHQNMRLNLDKASGMFLGIAKALEDLLWNLAQEKNDEKFHNEKGGSMQEPIIIPD